ncbi:hypothetical protein PIB30_090812, partial [Stylosanthes scabra]|nr:hypothetical protein [Stylosanthes scabra]
AGRVGAANREQLTATGLRLTAGRRSGEVAQWARASLSWLRCTDIRRSDEGRGPRRRSEKSCLRRGCDPTDGAAASCLRDGADRDGPDGEVLLTLLQGAKNWTDHQIAQATRSLVHRLNRRFNRNNLLFMKGEQ